MTLGGEIWDGTARQISMSIPWESIIFAGSEILSFEEVNEFLYGR
jgi:hypothetical protein